MEGPDPFAGSNFFGGTYFFISWLAISWYTRYSWCYSQGGSTACRWLLNLTLVTLGQQRCAVCSSLLWCWWWWWLTAAVGWVSGHDWCFSCRSCWLATCRRRSAVSHVTWTKRLQVCHRLLLKSPFVLESLFTHACDSWVWVRLSFASVSLSVLQIENGLSYQHHSRWRRSP